MKTYRQFIHLGPIGSHAVNCDYVGGKIVAIYFPFDEERRFNLLPPLDQQVLHELQDPLTERFALDDPRYSLEDDRDQ